MSDRFIGSRQTTIAHEIEITGYGVHSGAPVSVILHPAEADTGLRFLVTKRGRATAEIPLRSATSRISPSATVIGNDEGVTVGTVEHLLAALRGLSVDNCVIEIDSKSSHHGRQLGPVGRGHRRSRHPRAQPRRANISRF